QRLGQVTCAEVLPTVPFALHCEDRVRSAVDVPVHHAREVHAEEREARVRDRVDQVFDQVPLFGRQLVVLAAERDDLRAGVYFREARDAVRMQPGAVDQELRVDLALRGLEHGGGVVVFVNAGDTAAEAQLGAARLHDLRVRGGDALEVGDAAGRDLDRL